MSRSITDISGAAITVFSMIAAQNSDSQVLVIKVPCSAGMSLTCDGESSASVLARRTGSGDAFQDIAVSPISLTPFDGTTIQFDLKVHAGAFSGLLKRVSVPVRVQFI